jgi:hypothetical protein
MATGTCLGISVSAYSYSLFKVKKLWNISSSFLVIFSSILPSFAKMKSHLSLLGCVLYLANAANALEERASNWTVGQVVKTNSGPVSGHPATVNTGVSEYLGIPFAIPPVGDLRWTAPQQYNGTSAINGTKFVC